jgi:hypothetical protein
MVTEEKKSMTEFDFGHANLPRRFWESDLEGVPDPIKEKARAYVESFDLSRTQLPEKGLLFIGNVDWAERLAAKMLRSIFRRRRTVYFISSFDLDESPKDYDLDALATKEFLVLSGYNYKVPPYILLSATERLIIARHHANTRTVVISDFESLDEMDRSIGVKSPRLISAITQSLEIVEMKK